MRAPGYCLYYLRNIFLVSCEGLSFSDLPSWHHCLTLIEMELKVEMNHSLTLHQKIQRRREMVTNIGIYSPFPVGCILKYINFCMYRLSTMFFVSVYVWLTGADSMEKPETGPSALNAAPVQAYKL